jgi:hypothetical protein
MNQGSLNGGEKKIFGKELTRNCWGGFRRPVTMHRIDNKKLLVVG